MSNIPEEIKQKIADWAKKYSTTIGFRGDDVVNQNKQLGYIQGGLHGYSLPLQTIAEKDAEIKRLRGALDEMIGVLDVQIPQYAFGDNEAATSMNYAIDTAISIAIEALNNK